MKYKVYNKLLGVKLVDEKPVQPERDLRHAPKPELVPVETEQGEDQYGEWRLSLEELPLIEAMPRSKIPELIETSLQYWLDHLGPAIYNPVRAHRNEDGELVFQRDGGHRVRCLWEIGEPLLRVVVREYPRLDFPTRKYRRAYNLYNRKVHETNHYPPTVTHFRVNPDLAWRQYYPCVHPVEEKHKPYLNRFFNKETQDGAYYKDTLDSPMSFEQILLQNKALSYRFDVFNAIKAFGLQEKTILDVGSYFGHYCFLSLENGVWEAVGVEANKFRAVTASIIGIRKGLTEWNRRFRSRYMKIHEYLERFDKTFDYAYVLNVFHHLLVRDQERGWNTLRILLDRCERAFLMTQNVWGVFDEWDADIEKAVIEKTGATIQPLVKTRYRGRIVYSLTTKGRECLNTSSKANAQNAVNAVNT